MHLGALYTDSGTASALQAALQAQPRRLLIFGYLEAGRADAPQDASFVLEDGAITAVRFFVPQINDRCLDGWP